MKKLKEFKIIFFNGFEITRHYQIEDVRAVYLNRKIRRSNGVLDICIDIKEI